MTEERILDIERRLKRLEAWTALTDIQQRSCCCLDPEPQPAQKSEPS